jgi:hypothetical protein
MKWVIKIIFLFYFLTILTTCNSIPTEPEPLPGRRDYVWTIDTINPGNEALYLGRIWGKFPNDVWAVGSGSWTATNIWHYNGVQWRCDSIPRYVQPSAIFGIEKNQVWLGNDNNTIWLYNGIQWKKFGEYNISGYDQTCINYFDGTSSSNIYGVGFVEARGKKLWKAIIMRYNGIEWNFINVPAMKVSFETVAIETKSNILVMSGTVYDPSGFVAKVYCWDGRELKELLSDFGWSFVTKLGGDIFATLGSRIFKYSNKNLVLWKDNTGTGINGNIICGRNKNDFFIGSYTNGIVHYNGTDFTLIYNTNLTVERGMIFEKDVFFIGLDYVKGKNYIIRGKLK